METAATNRLDFSELDIILNYYLVYEVGFTLHCYASELKIQSLFYLRFIAFSNIRQCKFQNFLWNNSLPALFPVQA